MKVTVFCGSSIGNEIFKKTAYEFGKFLAQNNHELIYGGGSVGLMGAVSKGVKDNNGKVKGIITELLMEKELGNKNADELIIVKTMHERKALLAKTELFVTMPGGLGTLEEVFEVWTHAQLGYHTNPIAFLNINGYFNKLFEFLEFCVKQGFIGKDFLKMAMVCDNFVEIFDKIKTYKSPKFKY